MKTETRNIRFLCDQFIHSFIFVPDITRRARVAGFYFSSDWARLKKLYFVQLRQVLSAFRTIGRKYPSEVRLTRNPATGQF